MTERRIASRVAGIALLALLAAWLIFLRPTALGGATTYVFVGGDSMLPTYEVGDLIIVNPAGAYDVDTVTVFRIPEGELGAGRLVIHRIAGIDPGGTFTTRGDNNAYVDVWHPRESDLLGAPIAVVPRAGFVIAFLRQPIVIATIVALVVMSFFWRTRTEHAPSSARA